MRYYGNMLEYVRICHCLGVLLGDVVGIRMPWPLHISMVLIGI